MDFGASGSNYSIEERKVEAYIARRAGNIGRIEKGPCVRDGHPVPPLKWLMYESLAHSGQFDLSALFEDAPEPEDMAELPSGFFDSSFHPSSGDEDGD